MPATPKPPGQRRRRNTNQPQWRQLTARRGAAPKLPPKKPAWLKATREWWARIWVSPMASAWVDADLDGLYRLARLQDEVTRSPGKVSLHPQITALEDRFGLSPKARRALQWEIAQGSEDEEEDPAPRKRHLRAVG